MNIKGIIVKHLTDNGFDGLFYPGECACLISDMCPCESYNINECEPGYKVMCIEHGACETCECGLATPDPVECWRIVRNKPEGAR